MQNNEIKNKDNILMKQNTLVSARYNLTPNECRVFTYLLYKIQKNKEYNVEKSCTINQEEFKEIVNDKNKSTIKGITSILKSLKKNDIYLKERKEDKNNYIWSEYSFISGFEFDDELNNFKIVCAEKVYNTLMDHDYKNDGFYTPINLLVWFQFKLNSTQRIYELLRLWSNTKKTVNYTIDELREFMILEDKYVQYRDFKKRVILPAIKELKEIGELDVDIIENRVNRQVVSIDFIVKDMDKRIYFNKLNETKTELLISNNDSIKSDLKQAISRSNGKSKPTKKANNDKFYVPNKKLFTAKTLSDFIADFSVYNFNEKEYKKLLQESILIALEKDDEEKIKVKSYNYFKKILENKLDTLAHIETVDEHKVFKKTKFHNFEENFTKYSSDELDNIIEKSQKIKYK